MFKDDNQNNSIYILNSIYDEFILDNIRQDFIKKYIELHDISKINLEFNPLLINPNNFYVYFLINPITNKIFYVGKGQNYRAWEHLIVSKKESQEKKGKQILDIYSQNKTPLVWIFKENIMFEDIAYSIEREIIFLFKKDLTNKIISKRKKIFRFELTIGEADVNFGCEEGELTSIDNLIDVIKNGKIIMKDTIEYKGRFYLISQVNDFLKIYDN